MASGLFHTTYRNSIKRFQTAFVKLWLALFVIGLIIFPFFELNYLLTIMIYSGIATIAALGINILTGMTGQISLGHAAFCGIGAYTSAILYTRMGIPSILCVFMAGAVAALSGLIVGIPSLRLKGLYLAITTMAFQFIVQHLTSHWSSLTAGTSGLDVSPIVIGNYAIDTDFKMYFLVMFFVVLAITATANLKRSHVGRAFVAIRDGHIAAEVMGVELFHYKLLAFIISAFFAGIAGSLIASFNGFITPDNFNIEISIQYIAMIIVGGMGTVLGSIYGAVFMTIIPEVLMSITSMLGVNYPYLLSVFVYTKGLVFGLIIIFFLIYEPEGLYGRWQKIKKSFRVWPYNY